MRALLPIIFLALTISGGLLFAQSEWADSFSSAKLDRTRWQPTSAADFQEKVIDVVQSRLRLRADTMETDDATVKFLGVRSAKAFRIGREGRISFDLDWNDQANGSYLTAGIVLSPTKTNANPLTDPDWFQLEYAGVPPGRNARMFVAHREKGRDRWLFTEGWPDTNRIGRKISVQTVTIAVKNRAVTVIENGKVLYDSKGPVLTFDQAYLYLQMSSHSNYRPRELYFDNVRVSNR